MLKKNNATEHVTSSSSTATEHATSSCQSDLRLMLGDEDLEKIVALLLWMAQDFQSYIHKDDIHQAALAAVRKHVVAATNGSRISLSAASITKLSKLIDIMMLHKDGSPKDANKTLAFMRRVSIIREEILFTSSDDATERVERATSGDSASEHVELDKDEVSLCFRRFGRSWLTEDLLPHQENDTRYRLRNNFETDTHLSGFQRSVTQNVIRKFLGDKKVAFLIWQHGMPSIACRRLLRPRVDHKKHYMGMLQSSLNECLQWYICLANDIVGHEKQESFDAQVPASSLDEHERQKQQTRREANLAKERDHGKRSYNEEDFGTGTPKKAKPFRCNLQIKD